MSHYRVGIIGLSDIGCWRPGVSRDAEIPVPASHASAYAEIPGVEVVAVCDLKADLLENFAEVWGDVWPGATHYHHYGRMLADAQLDLLSVCTPDHAHTEIVVDACHAGVRGIFCEKPIATTLADADRMIEAAGSKGVHLSIDHTRRWRPAYLEAQTQLRAGVIGPVTRVVATLGGPRAMLFRNGTHLIDAILMLVESEPDWVFAELDAGFEDHVTYRGDGGRDPLSDPGVSGYIHFRNGVRAFVNASKGTPRAFRIELIGEKGSLLVSDAGLTLVDLNNQSHPVPVPGASWVDLSAGVKELVEKLDGSPGALTCPPEIARQVLVVTLGFLRSQELGNTRVNLADLSHRRF